MSATTATRPAPLLGGLTQADAAAYGIMILRVALGAMTLTHGLIKVFLFTPAGFIRYFGSMGLPEPFAWFVIAFEILGGLALILGVYTRIVAAAFVPHILGATLLVHASRGFMAANPGGGWEFPAFWTVALVALALLGDGAYALRRWR